MSRPFLLACLVNASMGILYVWSLFLPPMESRLGVARFAKPCPSIVARRRQVGMIAHDRLLSALTFRTYAFVAFGLAGGGHLLFGVAPTFGTLILGYGLFLAS
jgi:MFS transporter, OFA family, oxalate/formate antiporter